ncbi:MAG: hypothetical protein ACFFE4_13345 [Candidatus Thorarchaeota archaeon]
MMVKNLRMRTLIIPFISTIINILITIVMPFIIFISLSQNISQGWVDANSYISKFQNIISMTIFFGIGIILCKILEYYHKSFSFRRFLFGFLVFLLNVFSIIFWSFLTNITLSMNTITLSINLSSVYLFFIACPLILFIKKIYVFKILRRENMYKAYLLKIIQDQGKINTLSQIRKIIGKSDFSEKKCKQFLLRNLNKIMNELETIKYPLITKGKQYKLTSKGAAILSHFEKKVVSTMSYFPIPVNNYEMWSLCDLNKREKRIRSKIL